jgi:hypothetical protein
MYTENSNMYLKVPDSEELRMGMDDADFTVSWAMSQANNFGDWRNILHKGNSDGERTPAIWKYPGQSGLHCRIGTTNNGNNGVDALGVMEWNKWYYVTYRKVGQALEIYHDGVKTHEVGLGGPTVGNDGPLYFGRDPWYNGLDGASYDNLQIHKRALTEEEIAQTATGAILFNDDLVLAYDFGERIDGVIRDLSDYGNDGEILGGMTFPDGGAPEGKHIVVMPPPGQYMSTGADPTGNSDDSEGYLEIAHTDALALGQDNADFTV